MYYCTGSCISSAAPYTPMNRGFSGINSSRAGFSARNTTMQGFLAAPLVKTISPLRRNPIDHPGGSADHAGMHPPGDFPPVIPLGMGFDFGDRGNVKNDLEWVAAIVRGHNSVEWVCFPEKRPFGLQFTFPIHHQSCSRIAKNGLDCHQRRTWLANRASSPAIGNFHSLSAPFNSNNLRSFR